VCGAEIPGQLIGTSRARWSSPTFCLNCSAPYPWLDREGWIYLLENMLEEVGLDPVTALAAREQLEVLRASDLEPHGAGAAVETAQGARARALGQGRRPGVMTSVISAAMRAALGL
jgi:hypothetical protein